ARGTGAEQGSAAEEAADLAVSSEQEEVSEPSSLPVLRDLSQLTQWQWPCLAGVWAS
ncbi:hypothetical protein P7K49_013300, partial [Saguinus oedipus]